VDIVVRPLSASNDLLKDSELHRIALFEVVLDFAIVRVDPEVSERVRVRDELDFVLVCGQEIAECASLRLRERRRAVVAFATGVRTVIIRLPVSLHLRSIEVNGPVTIKVDTLVLGGTLVRARTLPNLAQVHVFALFRHFVGLQKDLFNEGEAIRIDCRQYIVFVLSEQIPVLLLLADERAMKQVQNLIE
jgi:hypothetical protein